MVGNKTDLGAERQVTLQEGKDAAATFQAPFFEASAKANEVCGWGLRPTDLPSSLSSSGRSW